MNILNSILILFITITTNLCYAQVNLDSPLHVGSGDFVFRSQNDPQVAYYFANSLRRVSPFVFNEGDERSSATFDVGIDAAQLENTRALVATHYPEIKDLRLFRALKTEILPGTSLDLNDKKFEPSLDIVGDTLNLWGPVRYILTVNTRPRLFKRSGAEKLFDQIFNSHVLDHLVTVRVEFAAVSMGQNYLATTALPVMVGTYPSDKNHSVVESNDVLTRATVEYDSESKCWSLNQPGRICLKTR